MKFIKGYKLFESERISVSNGKLNTTQSNYRIFTPEERSIIQLCTIYRIKNYIINDDFTIDVTNGDVDISDCSLTELPLRFNRVEGNFNCSSNQLTTLDGCPQYVNGDFRCDSNELESLINGPKFVGGIYYIQNNLIQTLDELKDVEFNYIEVENNCIANISIDMANKIDMDREDGGIGENPIDTLIYSLLILNIGYKKGQDDVENEVYLNIIERLDEFEVIQPTDHIGYYEIDLINLNRLFDFYDEEFDEESVKKHILLEFEHSNYGFNTYYKFV